MEGEKKIKVEKVIKEARGQGLSLRRLDCEMSGGEEMDRMKRTKKKKTQIMLSDISSSHAR